MPVSLRILLLFLITSFFAACSTDKGKNIPDVSHISVSLDWKRFDQRLMALDTNNLGPSVEALEQEFPNFADFYFREILGLREFRDSTPIFEQQIKGFVNFPSIRHVYDTTQLLYADLSTVQDELKAGFTFFKYYFPSFEPPQIISMISEFYAAILIPPQGNQIAVSHDLFLGPEYPTYYLSPLNLPRYITRTLTKEHMATKIMRAVIEANIPETTGSTLLDLMIQNGKKAYLLDLAMPLTPDSIKWEFTADQMEWCLENEREMWSFYISEDLLYKDDYQTTRKYVDHSPNSPGMPESAPGRTGNFIGMKIVQSFMARNPEVSPLDLLEIQNSQEILDRARYRP